MFIRCVILLLLILAMCGLRRLLHRLLFIRRVAVGDIQHRLMFIGCIALDGGLYGFAEGGVVMPARP